MTTLVCIEHPAQIKAALRAVRRLEIARPIYLALTPHVAYTLERMGQSHVQPEDYHTEEEIHALGMQQLGVLYAFCEEIDRTVLMHVPVFREYDLRPGSIAWYELKILLNTLAVKTFIFEKILRQTATEQVLFFDTVEEEIPLNLFFLKESVWARTIPAVCEDMGMSCRAVGMWKRSPDVTIYKGIRDVRQSRIKGRAASLIMKVFGERAFRSVRRLYRGLKRFSVQRNP